MERKKLIGIITAMFLAGLMVLPAWSDCGECDKDRDECNMEKKDASSSAAVGFEQEQRYNQAFTEIMLLNLINGLNLTEEQIQKFIILNKKVEEVRKKYEAEVGKLAEETLAAYQKLKETLEKNQGIPKDVEQKAFRMEQKVMELKEGLGGKLPEFEKEAEGVLTRAQIEIINTFNPCLVPPKNLKDPVRAGQANDNEMLLKLFQNIRSLPDEVFTREKEKIVTKQMEMFQKYIGKLTKEEYNEEKEYFLNLIEEIREMDDVEFELDGADLATAYMERGKKLKGEDLRDEMMQLHRTRRGGFGKVGMFLLNPAIGPILTKRLEIMKNAPKTQPADLDKIKTNPK